MRSLDEHLDQQELQKLLGEVIHHNRASTDHAAPDHQVLAKVAISRQVLMSLMVVKQEQYCRRVVHAVGATHLYVQRMQSKCPVSQAGTQTRWWICYMRSPAHVTAC